MLIDDLSFEQSAKKEKRDEASEEHVIKSAVDKVWNL